MFAKSLNPSLETFVSNAFENSTFKLAVCVSFLVIIDVFFPGSCQMVWWPFQQ